MSKIVINKELGDKIDEMIANLHEMGHDLFTDMVSRLVANHNEDEEVEKYCAEKLPVATINTIKDLIGD